MGEDAAHQLHMPSNDALLDDARLCFATAIHAVDRLDEEMLRVQYVSELYGNIGNVEAALVAWQSHNDRHLGMMEGHCGLLGLRGTATV
jgi:hypothetical protein